MRGGQVVHAVSVRDAARSGPETSESTSGGSRERPQVFLHVGEPKTGTTFLQQVMWRNRGELASQGVVLPGHHPQDHFRASQDLRGIQKLASDPAGSWTGEWDILASQARQAPRASVISHELFAAADEDQVERAVRSLQPAEVHVVVTARDIGTLLPAEWQETVKHRNSLGWEDWLSDVIDRESVSADRRQWWFWRVHDTLAILEIWSRFVPRERVHLITVPHQKAGSGLLWDRLASLLAVDPGSVDLSRARANSSLGLTEVEFLRRLNAQLPEEIPDWYYMWNVKETLAHQALAARPAGSRLVLPPGRHGWAAGYAAGLVAGLRESGADVVGDLDDLLPQPASAKAASPADESSHQLLETAVEAAAALVLHQYRRDYPAVKPQAKSGGLAGRVESTVAASPRLKRTVRELSSRHSSVRQMRVFAWRALERSRTRRSS
jgi:hypothetical protein